MAYTLNMKKDMFICIKKQNLNIQIRQVCVNMCLLRTCFFVYVGHSSSYDTFSLDKLTNEVSNQQRNIIKKKKKGAN
jgi:hypothetical protein